MPSGAIRRFATAELGRQALLVDRGRLAIDANALPASVRASIRETFGEELNAEEVVQRVLEGVRTTGDAALRHFTQAFDRATLDTVQVEPERIDAAVERVGENVMCALEAAAARIRAFHE